MDALAQYQCREWFVDEAAERRQCFGPVFLSDTWPLLWESHRKSLRVCVAADDRYSESKLSSLLSSCGDTASEIIKGRLIHLEKTRELPKAAIQTLKYLAYYNGHLNVFFDLAGHAELLRRLESLWPANRDMIPVTAEALGVENIELFSEVLVNLPRFGPWVGFGHDGQPMFVFSRPQ